LNLYDENLAVIISADHGENLGELGIYGEHATADEATCRIPMIIKWPGGQKGTHAKAFHDNTDFLPTLRSSIIWPFPKNTMTVKVMRKHF